MKNLNLNWLSLRDELQLKLDRLATITVFVPGPRDGVVSVLQGTTNGVFPVFVNKAPHQKERRQRPAVVLPST